MPELLTIGYEGATQAEVIAKLKSARVELLVDVRAVAASRRAGFSKTILAASLAAEGIDYIHLHGLGTPKAGREAARKGRIAEMHRIFGAHLETPEAQLDMAKAEELVTARRAALLCFEADAAGCHRRVIAERLAQSVGAVAVDL
ncbi:DUF488 domain-containing protein [Limibaculum sp. M0105]|uniref:DUF488 domain-containing protein n=1 Tax=Thermohalobaculum xanthum TaxID=2753746 RepID=A0A8J7M8L7_9RHOB|nr:DUF488 domain-containing protein [Thermohalobaculum xanthum]MBK0400609.1 DUF488 domain-containing protein [Thermohalobaculum xanthum]